MRRSESSVSLGHLFLLGRGFHVARWSAFPGGLGLVLGQGRAALRSSGQQVLLIVLGGSNRHSEDDAMEGVVLVAVRDSQHVKLGAEQAQEAPAAVRPE